MLDIGCLILLLQSITSGNSDDLVTFDGEYVADAGQSEEEDLIIQKYLNADRLESRTLADIILEKLNDKKNSLNVDINDSSKLSPKVWLSGQLKFTH